MDSDVAYVPRKRYKGAKRNDRLDPTRFAEWKTCIKFGGIYDLKLNSTRPATSAEYERRESIMLMPDDVPGLGPACIVKACGNVSKHPDIKRGTKSGNWTVGPKVYVAEKHQWRYKCTCDCKVKTVQLLTASDLMGGKRRGCLKCGHTRRRANPR